MKKNIMMRLSAILLVAVLLTTCVISGTWAKFVETGSATDEAQVAKWGVEITAETPDDDEYQATELTADESAVTVVADTKVLAPGAGVKFASINVTGTPEVAVKVTYTATLTFSDNWKVAGVDYMPLVFVINGTEYKDTTMAGLKTKVESAIAAYSKEYAADTDLSTKVAEELTVSCYWAYSTSAADDAKDTALGDLAAAGTAPTVSLTINCTVTQLDVYPTV